MHKQVWDITLNDLTENPVWYFPMIEEDGFDEASVMPADENIVREPNNQCIALSDFVDANGNVYMGFIYLGDNEIEYSQPCMFLGDEPVTFWFGIVKPNVKELKQLAFPIVATSRSVMGLASQSVTIEQYGYFNDKFEKQWVSR